MDSVEKHKKLVRELVEEISKLGQSSYKEIENELIIDDERGHYLLYSSGWTNESRTYGCFLHIDVKPDGKVYLQHDGTNLIIANELVTKGIDKENIVLEFKAPSKRVYTGFAN
ncbi:MAG: XisI protein [Thermoflexibacter sp.]|jgi:hypothetical protein|nr:XisI protein [Thermoflexibacter sp.]